jgi:hypothetical protein
MTIIVLMKGGGDSIDKLTPDFTGFTGLYYLLHISYDFNDLCGLLY